METNPLISEELAGFLESGLVIMVASRDDELQADGAWAWAAQVHEDRSHLTVFLYEKAATAMLRNLQTHSEIAVAFERPSDHRACQVKGHFVSSRRGRTAERAVVERQRNGFLTQLETIGIPRAMVSGWEFWPCVAIQLRATRSFEQTPGPGAGEPMP